MGAGAYLGARSKSIKGAIPKLISAAILSRGGGHLGHGLGAQVGRQIDAYTRALRKEKKAQLEAMNFYKSASDYKRRIAAYSIPVGLGALGLGGGLYWESTRKTPRGKSVTEERLENAIASRQGLPEKGLLKKVRNRSQEFHLGLARAFRQHPKKAALLAALVGGQGGYQIAKRLGIEKLIKPSV